jgi:hypothetical protein
MQEVYDCPEDSAKRDCGGCRILQKYQEDNRKKLQNRLSAIRTVQPLMSIAEKRAIRPTFKSEGRETQVKNISELKFEIVNIMVVARHCNDRTYGEVADEIIAKMEGVM